MRRPPPSVQAIDHVHVFVEHRATAERWYADTLGFVRSPAYEGWATGGGPLTLQDAGGQVHIALFERPPAPCRSVVALRTDAPGFLAWQAHLGAALGAPPSLEDHGLAWSLYFRDPDGNPYEITTYEHQAVAQALAGRGATP